MKGIVLAGGAGSRLLPITKGVSKQLLPVYDKPMVYYPISVLMLAGIRDILIITTPHDMPCFKRLLGSGRDYGISFSYAEQLNPTGIADALTLGRDFIGDDAVCLVLGDNIFHGSGFDQLLKEAVVAAEEQSKATVFLYKVKNPESYGVARFDAEGNCCSLEEKPERPCSDFAVVGLYFYPPGVSDIANGVKPSFRGEVEITSVNQIYLNLRRLNISILNEKIVWFDAGTYDSLSMASDFVQQFQQHGEMIACLEAIAYYNGWLSMDKLKESARLMSKNAYGQFLINLLQ